MIRLPRSKLVELQHLIKSWESRQSCTRKDLESLVGKLAHASQVVQPGRTFMRRMFELLAGTRSAHHHIRLSKAFHSDLQWWATYWHLVTVAVAAGAYEGVGGSARGEHFAQGVADSGPCLLSLGPELAGLSCDISLR